MRFAVLMIWLICGLGGAFGAAAQDVAAPQAQNAPANAAPKPPKPDSGAGRPMDVSADDSLEWYQDKKIYVARGNAKVVRGDMTITADLMTAHQRDTPKLTPEQKAAQAKTPPAAKSSGPSGGDIDQMTAEGNVVIIDPHQKIYGDHAVYDLDKHEMILTGKHLRYETPKETVTARDSLEYYEDKKLAVARGNAVADSAERHVEGDVLIAEFRDEPNGESQLNKMTAKGHVTVITKSDISKGDNGVYDAGRNIAIITGNVKITRPDNTQLSGDVGEVDFTNNQSRLLNNGTGRVRALLPAKSTDGAVKKTGDAPALSPLPIAAP